MSKDLSNDIPKNIIIKYPANLINHLKNCLNENPSLTVHAIVPIIIVISRPTNINCIDKSLSQHINCANTAKQELTKNLCHRDSSMVDLI